MKKLLLLICIFMLFFTMSVCAADYYEDCKVEVIDSTAWIWTDAGLFGKIYNVKDALVTRYVGSNENVILVVDEYNDLVERRYRSASSVTSKTVMEKVHAIKKADGRIYIQTTDGGVFERVYDRAEAKNLPTDEKVFENTAISVYVDGKLLLSDCEPYIKNDRTMVPMRAIFEALGAKVEWYNDEQIATGTKGDIEVFVKIGNKVLYKNGESIMLDAAAEIKNDRTMVPVRAISEAFGCSVTWDDKTKSVIVEGVDKAWDYTYLTDKAKKATIYCKTKDLAVAESSKTEDKATIGKLLRYLAGCNLTIKSDAGLLHKADERYSFSVYAESDTITVEILYGDIFINHNGKIDCYEISDIAAFMKDIRDIFGLNDPKRTKSVLYRHFAKDIEGDIDYFEMINKGVENESFVMTVNEIAGTGEYLYVTVSIRAKDEASKAYLEPSTLYGQILFDVHYDGAVAQKVFARSVQKWVEEDGAKVFLYRFIRKNYPGADMVKADSIDMMGEDIYFNITLYKE